MNDGGGLVHLLLDIGASLVQHHPNLGARGFQNSTVPTGVVISGQDRETTPWLRTGPLIRNSNVK